MKPYIQNNIFIICALVLLISGCSDRKVLSEIPREIRGVWIGVYSDPAISLIIKRSMIKVINTEHPSYLCRAEEIISYKEGWIFQEKKVAVVCDKTSTDKDQKEEKRLLGLIAPDDYRKTFYFSVPNKAGEVSVSQTKYMGRGWSDSEGIYIWRLDEFYKK